MDGACDARDGGEGVGHLGEGAAGVVVDGGEPGFFLGFGGRGAGGRVGGGGGGEGVDGDLAGVESALGAVEGEAIFPGEMVAGFEGAAFPSDGIGGVVQDPRGEFALLEGPSSFVERVGLEDVDQGYTELREDTDSL